MQSVNGCIRNKLHALSFFKPRTLEPSGTGEHTRFNTHRMGVLWLDFHSSIHTVDVCQGHYRTSALVGMCEDKTQSCNINIIILDNITGYELQIPTKQFQTRGSDF